VLCTACTPDGQAPPPKQTAGAAPGPATLSLAVYGPPAVLEAYRGIATGYADKHPDVAIDVQGHRDQDAELADVRARTAAGNPPDLFLVDHAALPEVLGRVWRGTDRGRRPLNQPVDELLGQRHLPFGDGYNRAGLEAFSANARLQCMPVELSPMVVYYNTDLLHLGRVAQPGDDPVNPDNGWSMEEFARAARLASTGRARGVAVAAGLEQVAPFVWSGGGELVDDPRDPTTTTLSDGASTGGLRQLLEIVRSPRLAVTPAQLVHRSAVQRFLAGRVGMVLGYRDLTPRLRTAGNLHFDVMPMPGHPRSRTIGSARALCLHRDSRQVDRAADLLAHMVSDHDSEALARTGYVMPSNLDAVNSPAFLQPARQPAHARVFDAAVRGIEFLPAGDRWRKAATMVDRALAQLWTRRVIDPLEKRLDAIDRRSRTVLAPQSQESDQP
jgi:multiple sugar transport system substrate-binding protein